MTHPEAFLTQNAPFPTENLNFFNMERALRDFVSVLLYLKYKGYIPFFIPKRHTVSDDLNQK